MLAIGLSPPQTDSAREIVMAREREFYKYCQLPQRPGLLHQPPLHSAKDEASLEVVPQASQDTTLTALAQLGALRLDAQRCMISLFDRHTQYILAESTRTLSLQDDRVHGDGDGLWLGSSVIPKEDGVCHYCCDESRLNAGPCHSDSGSSPKFDAFVIPDLTKDDRFNTRQYVVNAPYLRFYAGVPIRSRRGIPIGTFSVSDGRPRAGLNPLDIRFMTDTAIAIMNHLEMIRSHEQNRRSANMIAGLGNFLEGGIFPSSSRRRSRSRPEVDKEEDEEESTTQGEGAKSEALYQRRNHQTQSDSRALAKNRSSGAKSPEPPEESSDRGNAPESTTTRGPESATSRDRHPEVTLTSGTREIFARAAHLLQESLDVQGVVFFDASVNSYAGLVRNSDDRPSDMEISGGSSDGASGSDSENPAAGHSSTETDDSALCDVLGLKLEDPEQPVGGMRETFLRSLLRHYPRGAIFNIDENGGVSSSEGSDSASGSSVSREIVYRRHEGARVQRQWKQRKRQRLSLKEENKALMKVFPSARCVTLFPLWDSRRNRWFSGLFVWTKSPRVFSLGGELAYLYAFSNSIMAEIHRLDVELANKAHATLVGSISHELRSPLHGILGSTELLSDSSLTPAQTAVVNTIDHCGRSLLDIINNMLDFAKINHFTRKSRSSRAQPPYRPRRRPPLLGRSGSNDQPGYGVVNLISDVPLDAVMEEVIDSVFAGHCFCPKAGSLGPGGASEPTTDKDGDLVLSSPEGRPLSGFQESVTVIYEVDPDVRWLFETQAGAWRRILMNLFGNSLKYTQSGYVLVSLKSSTPKSKSRGRRLSRGDGDRDEMVNVTLTVKDSGQGIDKGYLQSNVFKPFSQEDPLSPGSGLGLSIVHQTVLSLGGKVDISSIKGVGTQVTVNAELPPTPNAESTGSDASWEVFAGAQESVRGKSIGLVGFAPPEDEDEPLVLLRTSLTRMFHDRFGMKVGLVSSQSPCTVPYDMYIVRASQFDEADDLCKRISKTQDNPRQPPILVICQTPQTAQKLSMAATLRPSTAIYEFISQPCGPCKMASALMSCMQRQQEQPQTPSMKEETSQAETLKTAVPALSQVSRQTIKETVAGADFSQTPGEALITVTTSRIDESAVTEISAAVESIKLSPSVLLVDDNEVNLKLLMAFMKKAMFSYLTASNGLEALEVYKAHSRQIRVVLMDISMPVMDGLESTREIRLFEKLQREGTDTGGTFMPATIIALSGLGSAPVRQEAFNSGVDVFLSKPVRFHELVKRIDELMA